MEKYKDSGAKGCSESVNDARDWEFLGDVLEWGSGATRKTKGGAAAANPTGTMVDGQNNGQHWYG